jgi:hypothetical protein
LPVFEVTLGGGLRPIGGLKDYTVDPPLTTSGGSDLASTSGVAAESGPCEFTVDPIFPSEHASTPAFAEVEPTSIQSVQHEVNEEVAYESSPDDVLDGHASEAGGSMLIKSLNLKIM